MVKRTGEKIKEAVARARELGPLGLLSLLIEEFKYWYRILRRSIRLFIDNRGTYQANTLAYRCMVSLVPMLAFIISINFLMGTDITGELQEILQKYVVPDSNIVGSTFEIITQFQEQARKGTIIGFLVLLLTSIFLINAIETIFNNIWHVTRRRPYASRALNYTAMTILIPVLLGISIYMTAQLQAGKIVDTFTDNVVIEYLPLAQWAWGIIVKFGLPLATVWALFLAMYKWLPNTRVDTKAALVPSLFAAFLFELCKWGFSFFAAQMVISRELWWGSLGVFLVFLMWVYLIWLIVLFGAQLTYVIQNYRYALRKGYDFERMIGESYLALRVMLEIAKRHLAGDHGPSAMQIAENLEVDVPRVSGVLSRLTDVDLAVMGTIHGKRGAYEEVYMPGKDIATISLAEVIWEISDLWLMPGNNIDNNHEDTDPEKIENESKTPERSLELVLKKNWDLLESNLSLSLRDLLEQ